jgi:FkbM family methyltransferase
MADQVFQKESAVSKPGRDGRLCAGWSPFRKERLSIWHDTGRTAVNAIAALFGVRIVNAGWGPRGVFDTLRRAKSRAFAPALVFDIGASNGQWTRECLSTFPAARYILIDPLECNREPLKTMAAQDNRITVWCGAAGASPGRLQIYEHGDQSSVLASQEFSGPLKSVEVGTVDLLFESQGSPAPVLFKADVQGYELEVLRGASRCLQSAEMLVLEVSYRRMYQDSALAHEIIAYVGDRGFRIYDVCSYLQRPADGELVQSDLVFVHESSPLFRYQGWDRSP